MKKRVLLLCLFLLFSQFALNGQQPSFKNGERIFYTIFYSVIGLYVNAGSASFTATRKTYKNQEVFHAVGEGASNSSYDWIFKVRDRYESIFHADNLKPLKFIRDVNEGKYKKYQEVLFDHQSKVAKTEKGIVKIPEEVQDVISVLYFARNIDYTKYNKGDKIPFNMFLDSKVYNMYIRYEGKETIKTRFGKFNVLKLKPLLLEGNIFRGGEKMSIWVTDDLNHVPVRIETPISVGSIKVDLVDYRNLKHPLKALIKRN